MAMRRMFQNTARAGAQKRFATDYAALAKEMNDWKPVDIVKKAFQDHKEVCISFSGAEDVLLIELARQAGVNFRVFSLDTGRLHPETYQLFLKVEDHYGVKIEYTFPDAEQTMELVQNKGMFSFYQDGHAECCGVRKVGPLKKKLSTLNAWITGVRQDQSVTRTNLPVVQQDPVFKGADGTLIKYNPLSNVTKEEVWAMIRSNGVPYNELHAKGFVSIGCEPCTRPTLPGQHEREGRWWWESAAEKECGLHQKKTNH
eukprot:TRINITY_DN26598_c0_g1_i1.p1 TRINITY_DN26598_c0_g1~~TRINITY_DN26598_c0_g1_i1.p1  ORF type:complete len:273 (+),score=88.86 TRINITY_DN26598_c0_g1_i1:51-821(+)